MPKAVIEERGSIAILRMQNGVTNPIGPGLVSALETSLTTVEKEFQGVVLAGGEKFFSIGFNLPVLISYDRKRTLSRLLVFPFHPAAAGKSRGHFFPGLTRRIKNSRLQKTVPFNTGLSVSRISCRIDWGRTQ